MDQQTGFSQLNLLQFQCSLCNKLFPSYRVFITFYESKEGQQLNQNQDRCRYFCIRCYSFRDQVQNSRDGQKTQLYHDIAKRYIRQLPLPEQKIAEKCLQAINDIQKKSNQVIKQVQSAIDEFKFFILRLVKQTTRTCQNYLKKLHYYQKLRIQQRFQLQCLVKQRLRQEKGSTLNFTKDSKIYERLKSSFYINQSQTLYELNEKYEKLADIKKKILVIRLQMPQFRQQPTNIQKRVRLYSSRIPVTSILSIHGKNYFGTADGHVVYTQQKEAQPYASLKAHDALVRSLAHNNEYILYTGSDDFTIKAWSFRNKEPSLIKSFGILGQNKSYHRNICLVQQGKSLVSTRGQFDQFKIRLWDSRKDYNNTYTFEGHQSFIRTMAIADKEKNIIVTGSDDKKIKFWSMKSSSPFQVILRPRKCTNIIVSSKNKLLCSIQQDNKMVIFDLLDYQPLNYVTLPRKILCSCGYTKINDRDTLNDNDYIVTVITTNIGIWRWDLQKIWSFNMQITYAPNYCVQINHKIALVDGSGLVDYVNIGNIEQIDSNYWKQLKNIES